MIFEGHARTYLQVCSKVPSCFSSLSRDDQIAMQGVTAARIESYLPSTGGIACSWGFLNDALYAGFPRSGVLLVFLLRTDLDFGRALGFERIYWQWCLFYPISPVKVVKVPAEIPVSKGTTRKGAKRTTLLLSKGLLIAKVYGKIY